jgi:hypothetical protein
MVMGGMGSGELVYWSDNGYESLVSQLDSGVRVIRIDLPGRKRGRGIRPFYTFIGSDAVKALKQYLEVRKPGEGPIFYNQFGGRVYENILTEYWRRQLLSLGLRKAGEHYGKNLHEVRDLFRSRWQKSGADGTSAEFFMGHVIDVNGYNKAFSDVDYARSQYDIVEKWLNIVSNDPEKVPKAEVDRQMKAFEERQTRLEDNQRRINEEMMKRLSLLGKRL